MSKNKRRKIRLTHLDYVIIFSVLFFVVGLYSRYTMEHRHSQNASAVTADIVFEIHSVTLESASALISDTSLYTARGTHFGEVMIDTVSVRPSVLHVSAPDGSIQAVESKSLYDVEAVAVAHGAHTEGGFFLSGDTYIAPNMKMTVKSSNESFEIYVTNIEIF